MAARCGQMLLSFVLVLVFVLMLVPVLVLVLVPCSFYFSSPSCSSCPPWSSFVVLVVSSQRCVRRGSRCPRCPPPAPRIFFACVLVLLLEEQRRENPHATAGNVREQSYALTCSTCLFAEAVFAEDPPPSSTEQQSAPSRWREFPAKLFSERRRPLRTGEPSAGRGARAAPFMAPMWAVGRTRGANQPVAPLN